MEADQVDILSSTMFRHLKQVQNTQKPRLASQFRSNIRKPDRLNRVHLNLAFLHAVPGTHPHPRTHPDPHTARNLPALHPVPKPFGKHHAESLTPAKPQSAPKRGFPMASGTKI